MPPRPDKASGRSVFIKHAIAALEAKPLPANADLAAHAFTKLHYDFPVVTAAEIHALAEAFRDSVGFKDGWFPYRLTAKLTENAVAGATLLQAQAQAQVQPQVQPQPQPEAPAGAPGPPLAGEGAELQGAYCQLCASILISFMRKVLSLPEADAWALLEDYHPSSEQEGADAPLLPDVDQYRLQGGPADGSEDQPAEEGPSCEAAALEAAELDHDDFCYEDMDTGPPKHSIQIAPAVSAAGLAPFSDLDTGTCSYSWDKLRTRVLHLGLQLSYAAVASPGVWLAGDGRGASDAVLELLRVLGIHDRSEELQPLLHTYANLLADRLCDDPSGMAACLEQLWEALGVAQLAASARPGQAQALAIPSEASVAFSLVLQLASQYGGTASAPIRSSSLEASASSHPQGMMPLPRQELWRQVHGSRLLELAARCLADLSAAPQLGPEQLAAASLISQVLVFYLRQRPGGVDAAKQLLNSGVVRGLAVLLPKACPSSSSSTSSSAPPQPPAHDRPSSGGAAEPLRQLALLCAACSPSEAGAWLLAVPGFKAWLHSDVEMQPGGKAEAHGALWQLLTMSTLAGSGQKPTKGEGRSLASADGAAAQDPISALLHSLDLGRLQSVLRLMSLVHQTTDGKLAWGPVVQARMKGLAEELRGRAAETSALRQPSGASQHAAAETDDTHSDSSDVSGDGQDEDEIDDDLKLHQDIDPEMLKARRAKQLGPGLAPDPQNDSDVKSLQSQGVEGEPSSRPGTSSVPVQSRRGSAGMSRPGARPLTATGSASQSTSIPGGSKFLRQAEPKDGKEAVNRDILQTVRQTFMEADEDGSGQLAPDEFVQAFTGILQTEDGGDAEALGKLFCRIDANCDGTVDWDEFSSYMLLESAGSASIRELETAIDLMPPVSHRIPEALRHQDLITHMSCVQLANGTDRYITCGKDGMVKVWNPKDMSHLRSINTGKSWVTCAKMLPFTHKLAVASFARSMKIFDLGTYELCGQIQEIDYAPMSMDVWVPRRNRESEMVVFGDGGGFVRLYEVRTNPLEDKNSNDRYLDVPIWKHQHHSDWVTSVKYVEDLNCVIAGSLDKLVSITDAEERVPLKVLDGHTKGVTSVDWSPLYKFVCSGGQDRKIILWNPFSQKPLAQLNGHPTSVQQVLVNDKDNQIISLGSDKSIKVWDIRNHRCLQTLTDRELYKLDDTLLTMAFDHRRKLLLTGNTQPKTWQQTVTSSSSSGHRDPVAKVMYNPLFNEAVSGDHAGTVSVWHVPTGKLRFRFYNAHKDQRITAMSFDTLYRRLITGTDNGEVKVWNFSSGSCISHLKPAPGSRVEVTAVMAVRGSLVRSFLVAGWDRKVGSGSDSLVRSFLVAGWNRKVTFFEDGALKEVGPGRCLKGHESDVLAMAVMDGHPALATACDDGTIWIWNVDSGAFRKKLIPEGMPDKAVNERAAEALSFLRGRNKHILAAVYADRFLRLWDIQSGACVLEVFTGHKLGETVMALAVDNNDQRIATADSAGFIKIWDISTIFFGQGGSQSGEVVETCVWKGHKGPITALDWAEQPHGKGCFLLSSSLDKAVKLWSDRGALVGIFGVGAWRVDEPGGWKEQDIKPLEDVEVHDMETSRLRPDQGFPGSPSMRRLTKQFSSAAASSRPSTAPAEVTRVLQASYAERMSRIGSLRVSRGLTSASQSRPPTSQLVPQGSSVSDAFPPLSCPGPAGSSPGHVQGLQRTAPWMQQGGQEASEDDTIVESDESSSHESDEDVPAALWMEEFEAARRVRVSGRAAPGGSGGASGSGPGQRRSAYVPPKGVSELATLPQRPSTSYSSSKGR